MKSAYTVAYLVLACLLIPGMSGAQDAGNSHKNQKEQEVKMSSTQKNKETIRKIYEQALNRRNMNLLRDLISEDYTGIKGKKGAAAFAEPVGALIQAFPDIQWNLEELIGEHDKVFVRWIWQGTHANPFLHYMATGKAVSNDGMAVYAIKDGKVVSSEVLTDRLGFLQQIEVLPADLILLSNRKIHKDQVRFIDKFLVPEKAREEFVKRMNINRNFIRDLNGFVEDAVYERTDEQGNRVYITIAVWENEDALKRAKEKVQAEYDREGFSPSEMLERLNISMDRGIYKLAGD